LVSSNGNCRSAPPYINAPETWFINPNSSVAANFNVTNIIASGFSTFGVKLVNKAYGGSWARAAVTGTTSLVINYREPPGPGSITSTDTTIQVSWGTRGNESGTPYQVELRAISGAVV
jgi:hypothetical protein